MMGFLCHQPDTCIGSKWDSKGKHPNPCQLLPILPILSSNRQMKIKIHLNSHSGNNNDMINKLHIILHQFNCCSPLCDETLTNIRNHDWSEYLKIVDRFKISTSTISLEPAISHLLDFTNQHYENKIQHHIRDIQLLIESTHHKLIMTYSTEKSTEDMISELFMDSLNNFTSYIRHKFQHTDPKPQAVNDVESDSTILSTSVSSDAMINQLMSFSNVTEVELSQSSHNTSGKNKRNRKSKKDRIKQPHNSTTCTRPECYSCAKDNIFNLTGRPLGREQILTVVQGIVLHPKDSREYT